MKSSLLTILALLVAPIASAQLQFDTLDGIGAQAKESVEITLDSAMLRMANGLLSSSEKQAKGDQLGKLLANLKGITVRAYEFVKEGQYDANLLAPFRQQLSAQRWSRMISAKDGGETVELYSKTEQGKSLGFVIVAAARKELAVIHIDGSVDLADLSKLGGQFGIPKIEIPGVPQPGQAKGKQ